MKLWKYYPLEYGSLRVEASLEGSSACILIVEDNAGWKEEREFRVYFSPEVRVVGEIRNPDGTEKVEYRVGRYTALLRAGLSEWDVVRLVLYDILDEMNQDTDWEYDGLLYELEDEFEDVFERAESLIV
ncbi:protein of unknown function (plasmid) [Thermococcus nautili]|uniref:hypothetical protein n=1 Tax=Thermococcus nautili TaxID=195522 RepID=UPI0025572932|nr:hypothetical protein [Thermococcus nautili]CAI1494220.1 protein of unknown function [Thermococcus nautili]